MWFLPRTEGPPEMIDFATTTNNFKVVFRDNKTGEPRYFDAIDYTIEDALMKALRMAGAWNWTVTSISEDNN